MFSSSNTRLIWVSVSLSVLVTVAHADRLDMLGMGILRGDLGSVATDINDLGVMTGCLLYTSDAADE